MLLFYKFCSFSLFPVRNTDITSSLCLNALFPHLPTTTQFSLPIMSAIALRGVFHYLLYHHLPLYQHTAAYQEAFLHKIWILLIQTFFFRKSAHSILIIKWYKIFLCQCFSYLVTHTSTLSCNRDYHV